MDECGEGLLGYDVRFLQLGGTGCRGDIGVEISRNLVPVWDLMRNVGFGGDALRGRDIGVEISGNVLRERRDTLGNLGERWGTLRRGGVRRGALGEVGLAPEFGFGEALGFESVAVAFEGVFVLAFVQSADNAVTLQGSDEKAAFIGA